MVSSYGVESTDLGFVLTICASGSGVGDGDALGRPLFLGGVMNDFVTYVFGKYYKTTLRN